MTHSVIVAIATLGVIGQVLGGLVVVLALLRLAGLRAPWRLLRDAVRGQELWWAFAVALIAASGSLFFSEVAHFPPCKLCWFQRIAMYPLVLVLLPALAADRRAARYFLPLPLVGLGVAAYHLLVENRVIKETASCQISAPGGCAVKWVNEFGYVTIPILSATAAFLVAALLLASWYNSREEEAAVESD